jgi:hypothetical protein
MCDVTSIAVYCSESIVIIIIIFIGAIRYISIKFLFSVNIATVLFCVSCTSSGLHNLKLKLKLWYKKRDANSSTA